MEIKLYLSKQGYDQKPDESASIIKTFSTYNLVDIEVEDLYKKLINGHYMHAECGYSISNTGKKVNTFKKSLLEQTQVMCIDLDYKLLFTKKIKNEKTGEIEEKIITREYSNKEMPDWNESLLSNLKYTNSSSRIIDVSPTFWMESFSAHKNTPTKVVGNNIHLFYVFYDPIYNVKDFEKVAISIIYAIYRSLEYNGYDIPLEKERCPFDPVSTDMFQGLWGSSGKMHAYNGNLFFWPDFKNAYKDEFKSLIFQKTKEEENEASFEEIKKTIEAYSSVNSIDDIDISKCQYLKYKEYFGHDEGFHIMSVLKHEYSRIEEGVNSRQSLCYQVCKKLLFEHCSDFFESSEDKFYHEYARCKIYNKKGTNVAAYMNHVIRLIGDTGAIPIIEYKQVTENEDNLKTIKINKNEYLSDKMSEILELFDNEKINFIIAPPGLGKTVFAKSLEGINLIIQLYNSIIQSEEKFPSAEFTKFYENNYINSNNITKNNVCSANKFVFWYKNQNALYDGFWLNNDDCLFDNIILDESHLLCLSNYRYEIMGETVQYIKKLKADYPKTNVIIMTGTPFGEKYIFDNLNIIKIESEKRFPKKFHMIQTSSIEGYMMQLVKEALSKGLRVFIPVDSEIWFKSFVKVLVKEGIIAEESCYYFNQPKHMEEKEVMILNTKQIGDIKILGTSSYMSVGIDIEDWRTEFVTIIPSGASSSGNFSGIEVEQFANRHRKQVLEVHYVISKNESNTNKPIFRGSCRGLLNIKNDLLKSMYRTDPIVIPIPAYMKENNEGLLEVNEDMFKVYTYYKDMKPIISHAMVIYEYMESIGWECDWTTVDNVHRGINTKENREAEKEIGVSEFMNMLESWAEAMFCPIKVSDSVSSSYSLVKVSGDSSLFDVERIEVEFTNYYAKNTLFQKLLNCREYLTGFGTYNLIKDSYENGKINMSFIDRTLLAIKIMNNCKRTGLWDDIYNKLRDFYNKYSCIENGVTKDNKKLFESERDSIIQGIWDSLSEKVEGDLLVRVFNSNYENVTENLIDDFMKGIKLVQTMYLEKKSIQKKINRKNVRVTIYSWSDDALSKYEIRDDKSKG